MDRRDHLRYCKVCKRKSFDLNKGIVCGLTGEIADFADTCPHFSPIEKVNYGEEKEEKLSLKEVAAFFRKAVRLRFYATPLLILACTVYYFMSIRGSEFIIIPMDADLYRLGALVKSLTINGEPWRLISYQFLHTHPMHLGANFLVLFSVGFLLERLIGSIRLLLTFIVGGVAAGAFSILLDDHGVTVGASGSIFSLFGVFLVLMTTRIMDKTSRLIILITLAVYMLISLYGSLKPGIDFAAHAGGMISGLIMGIALRPTYSSGHLRVVKAGVFGSGLLVTLLLSFLIIWVSPSTENRFDAKIKQFHMHEQQALRMMNKYGSRNVNLYVSIVNKSIVPTWRKCRRIISETNEIEGATEEMITRSELLMDYCDVQAKWCQLNAYGRKLGIMDYGHMMEYCDRLRDDLLTRLHDTSAVDTGWLENSFSTLFVGLPDDRTIVLDGQPVPDVFSLEDRDPLEVVTIQIWHKNTATRRFGKFGENGVIYMKTAGKIKEDVLNMPAGRRKDELMNLYRIRK